jgi:ribosomal protein S20
MNYFKTASDMLIGVKELEQPTLVVAHNEKVAIREGRAGYLQTLAIANNVSASFAEYHSAIRASESAMVRQDNQEAEEHLARAESVLDDIQNKIQITGDSNKEERVKAFVEDMKAHLSKIVAKAENDSTMTGRKTLMMEASSTIRLLDNTVDVDELIKITADSSRIQVVLREYSAVLADLESIEETKDDVVPTDDSDDGPHDADNEGVPSNNGTGNQPPDEESEAEKLMETADALEDRANALLAESDNVVATLKINAALTLIATARIDIDAGHFDAATIALSSAEAALDIAEELIR